MSLNNASLISFFPGNLPFEAFFPSKNVHNGSYIFDQIKEIKKQTDFEIIIVKVSSLFSKEKDYIFKGLNVSVFKIISAIFSFLNKSINLLSFM